ncbi:TRAP transporter substrate-binding protein DctP [Tianweitania sp. BSSL-BM11]|uniref:TRAP transporter substrate-binding protein DctP n=1 Tax=Tianweitania aestuarii TaxID=2814886 RepID=A0ABS5RY28_9HYPH|nr:TRAP transporter substrate-binding protein DctP [Tianweitania aestuarii]MBS9721139.1 TRAP transporter substrate-binding protein DctP [Tianweitania aestuarii]
MKMKHLFLGLAALPMALVAFSAQAQEFTLRVADSFPTTHPYSINTKAWLDLVTKRTDGRVAFSYFPAEQLAKSADLLDAAENRLADIVYAAPLYLSDRLPLSTVIALPLIGNITDPQKLNDAFNELALNELNEAELLPQNVRAIRTLATAPYQLMLRGDKIETLDGLKGKKIRSSGGVQERSVAALGAVPVAIPAPDLYPALQRGTIDGSLFNTPTAAGYKIQEQLKWSTDNVNLGLFPVLYVINEDVWQGLPEDIQTIMMDTAREVVPPVIQADNERHNEFGEALKQNGGGYYQISDAELQKWQERLEPIWDNWVSDLDGRNQPGKKIFDRWTELATQ